MLNTVISLFFLATSLEVSAQNTSASIAATTAASSSAQATTKATQAPASSSSPCDPWPKLNKNLTDCCIIPHHTDLNIERSCFVVASKKTNLTINSTTIGLSSTCYFQATKLVVDGKADKEVAKAIYKNQSEIYTKFIGHNPWATTIDDAVTKCEIPAGANMTENLIKFYLCTNDYLKKNCPLSAIDSSDACDQVEEHYEQCKGPKPNCDEWPMKLMLPEYCCNCPEIVLPSVMSGCYTECKGKTSQREKATCVLVCKNKKLDWKKNGKFDFDVIKSLLMANALKSDIWGKSIAIVVETCKTVIEEIESKAEENHVEPALIRCLNLGLSDNCVDFKAKIVGCNKIKRFLKRCPDTKPKRSAISTPSSDKKNKHDDNGERDKDKTEEAEHKEDEESS